MRGLPRSRRQRRRSNGGCADEAAPDLTVLAEKNGGEFPYNKVFAVIDGRFIVPGHGERDMPIWGRQFFEEDSKAYGPNGGEIVAQERIHELTNYLGSLQK